MERDNIFVNDLDPMDRVEVFRREADPRKYSPRGGDQNHEMMSTEALDKYTIVSSGFCVNFWEFFHV